MPSHSANKPSPFRPLLLTQTILLICAGATLTLPASAQTSPQHTAQKTQDYHIPAGRLDEALNRFASSAGILLAIDGSLTRDLQSPGLQGSYPVEQGLAHLLKNTGLEAVHQRGGSYVLRKIPGLLQVVTVEARRATDGTTEDNRSYTSRVTSIASKTDQSFREIPQSVSVLTHQQIEDQRVIDVTDALVRVPGLKYDGTTFYSRGFGISAIQVDGGAPLAMGDYTYSLQQDMAFYDRIEVMRGASGLLGGVGDPGGIINLARKKPLAKKRTSVTASAGSWDNYRAEIDASSPLGLDGRLRGRLAGVYQNNRSYVDYRSSERPGVYGVLEMDVATDSLFTVGGMYAEVNNNGAPPSLPRYNDGRDLKLSRSANLSQPWAYDDTDTLELFAQWQHRLSNDWQLKINVSHSDKDVERIYSYTSGAVDPVTLQGPKWGAGKILTSNKQYVIDASLSGTFDLLGKTHEFVAGMDWQHARGTWDNANLSTNWTVFADAFNPGAWNPSMTDADYNYRARYAPWGQEQLGGYGVLRLHPADNLHVVAGVRASQYEFIQNIETKRGTDSWQTSQDVSFDDSVELTPYGGIIYDLNDNWSGYISYSSIYKPQPLLMAGPPPGYSLPPVTGKSYETGFKGELFDGRANATFSVFHVERTGTAITDPDYPSSFSAYDGNCCFLSQGEVSSRGFDVEVSGEITDNWQLAAGYTYNTTRDKSTEKSYSSITPRHIFKISTAYNLPGSLSPWRVGGEVLAQSHHFVRGTAISSDGSSQAYDFTQGGYAVWNTFVQYQHPDKWSVTLNLQNLFDKTYYQGLGSTSANNVYGTPANAMLTFRSSF